MRYLEYAEDVRAGRVVVGELTRLAIERQFKDLARARTDSFPFYFNQREADRVCDFFEQNLFHSVGRFAGKPFLLEPWQRWALSVQYGWQSAKDNTRRFTQSLWTMARKNGKSTIGAGKTLLHASADVNPHTRQPEARALCVLGAPKMDQAKKVIYAEVVRMRKASQRIADQSREVRGMIKVREGAPTEGEIFCAGTDRPFSGLNPSYTLLDELHEFTEIHRPFWDTMVTAMGARDQGLLDLFTTAGDDKSYIWREEQERCEQILKGRAADEEQFVLIYQMDPGDDWYDEANWPKSNPNLDVSVSSKFLRKEAKKRSPIDRLRFGRYHANVRVSNRAQALDSKAWHDLCKVDQLSDWTRAVALGAGVDLGGRDDLASLSFCAKLRDESHVWYEVQAFSYLASQHKRDLRIQPWATFVAQGHLIVCDYPELEIEQKIRQFTRSYPHYEAVAYDPRDARGALARLETEGVKCGTCGQTYAMFNEPIRKLQKLVEAGEIRHDGNPVLEFAVENAMIKSSQDRWMYDKDRSDKKIDPVVSMTMAFKMAYQAQEKNFKARLFA